MNTGIHYIVAAAARSLALLLCIVLAPFRLVTGAKHWPGASFWEIACGRLAFVGPVAGQQEQGMRPGWISPQRLQQCMGIQDAVGTTDDAAFFKDASLWSRITLVLRYVWVSIVCGRATAVQSEIRMFGVRIDALSMREAVYRIIAATDLAGLGPMKTVAFVNPDCLNKAITDRQYHHLLNESDLVLPDGSGLRIAARLLKLPLADNVNGTDLFPMLCEAGAKARKRIFLFGGRPGVALDVIKNIQKEYPDLEIAGCLDGYSHSDKPHAVIRAINASNADILLVGLGAPHQERWLAEHGASLNCAVGVGVGGLFDYYAGRIARAPLALREAGLEWVWRILQEPGAKWRRYVFGNPLFLLRVLRERRQRKKLGGATTLIDAPMSAAQWARTNAAIAAVPTAGNPDCGRGMRRRLMSTAILKRALDVVVAGGALIALSPLLLMTAALIRLESAGPILFKQQRVGRRGKPFGMLKFRSMYIDAEARLAELQVHNESAGGVLFKMRHDPRVTRVGRFIRRFSIDELPQIINVLRGEMAIVGPRPALPSEVENYSAADRKRLQTKPGLTCLWQIGGRSDLSFEQQIELDREYLKRQSVTTDLEIIAKTVPAVIGGKGAY
ncbi:MAG: WecB/TagA/CpsF family glycosyltransferase [Pseudomonadota bacterium]